MNNTSQDTATRANILIVDDNLINRKKISRAVENLGHDTQVAEDGVVALKLVSEARFDAILLDIMMPEMDGFAVLERLGKDEKLRDIPVIVISSLEDERESVVRALELGAEDFLPKNFDHVILRARLNASLTKKRFRDQEREYFDRINRLKRAATQLEQGQFNPERLDLADLVDHKDAIGRLALVFRGMAAEIYSRELRLRQTIHKLRGSLLVIAIGVVWGITPSLGRLAAENGSNPLGIAVWTNGAIGISVLVWALVSGRLPKLGWRDVAFFFSWGILAGTMQRVTMFIASSYVEAAVLSLILALQGFMVFAFAALTRREKATPTRLLGLLVGLIGVGIVMWTKFDQGLGASGWWLLFSMAIPLLLSIEAVAFAGRIPTHVNGIVGVGLMMFSSFTVLLPTAYVRGDLMPLSWIPGQLEFLVLLLSATSLASYLLAVLVIRLAGAIFYSQSAYTMTIAGVIWGMLLLNETFSVLAWVAFGVILVGMYLVEPKAKGGELIIKRNFDPIK